jgi:hypothetical protein
MVGGVGHHSSVKHTHAISNLPGGGGGSFGRGGGPGGGPGGFGIDMSIER